MPSASVDLYCIDPGKIEKWWRSVPALKRTLSKAFEATELGDIGWLEKELLEGKQLLWMAWGKPGLLTVATTTIIKPFSRKICVVTACAVYQQGEDWLPLFERVEKYAKDEGCEAMRIIGRKGWQRVLDGYRVEHVVLEKELGRD